MDMKELTAISVAALTIATHGNEWDAYTATELHAGEAADIVLMPREEIWNGSNIVSHARVELSANYAVRVTLFDGGPSDSCSNEAGPIFDAARAAASIIREHVAEGEQTLAV